MGTRLTGKERGRPNATGNRCAGYLWSVRPFLWGTRERPSPVIPDGQLVPKGPLEPEEEADQPHAPAEAGRHRQDDVEQEPPLDNSVNDEREELRVSGQGVAEVNVRSTRIGHGGNAGARGPKTRLDFSPGDRRELTR